MPSVLRSSRHQLSSNGEVLSWDPRGTVAWTRGFAAGPVWCYTRHVTASARSHRQPCQQLNVLEVSVCLPFAEAQGTVAQDDPLQVTADPAQDHVPRVTAGTESSTQQFEMPELSHGNPVLFAIAMGYLCLNLVCGVSKCGNHCCLGIQLFTSCLLTLLLVSSWCCMLWICEG